MNRLRSISTLLLVTLAVLQSLATAPLFHSHCESLQALSEKLADDPTYVIRGQRYTDPPAPGAAKK